MTGTLELLIYAATGKQASGAITIEWWWCCGKHSTVPILLLYYYCNIDGFQQVSIVP